MEGIAEKVELDPLVLSSPVLVLAVDDFGLRWMQFQTAVGQPSSDGFQHRPRFPFAPAMNDRIIRITLKADAWIVALHPLVKRVVQEQVGEQRTGDATLRGALGPLLPGAVRPLNGSAKSPPNVQPDPGQVSVMCDGTFDPHFSPGSGGIPILFLQSMYWC